MMWDSRPFSNGASVVMKTLLVVLAADAALLAYAGLKTPDYAVERQITIKASAEKIFPS